MKSYGKTIEKQRKIYYRAKLGVWISYMMRGLPFMRSKEVGTASIPLLHFVFRIELTILVGQTTEKGNA